jgi:hypothetical protein
MRLTYALLALQLCKMDTYGKLEPNDVATHSTELGQTCTDQTFVLDINILLTRADNADA